MPRRTRPLPPCGNPRCSVSTGIHEGLTFGSGELSEHGYWRHPCPTCARAAEVRDRRPDGTLPDGPYWPFAEHTDHADSDGG